MKKMITLLLAALCCAQVSFACPYVGPYQEFTVQDRVSNLPLTGATITILYQNKPVRHITLDSTGSFFMRLWSEELPYKLVVKHEGYIALNQSLHVSDDNNLEINIWLSPVKRAKMVVREIERLRYRRQLPLTPLQLQEHLNQSIQTDQSFHSMLCKMQHFNRKDQSLMTSEGVLLNDVLLYPNPLPGGSQLYVESKFDGQKLLVIYDMAGMEVLRSDIVFHSLVETSGLKTGMYILKVIDPKNEEVVTQKFMIQ